MDKNTKKQTKKHFKKLLRSKMKEEIGLIEDKNKTILEMNMRQDGGELSNYDNHPADIGSELFEQEHHMGLKAMYSDNLEKIKEALSKVGGDGYGVCERCAAPIDEGRLEILPETKLCIDCAKERDGQIKLTEMAIKNRPYEENNEVLTPFGTKFVGDPFNPEQRNVDALTDVLEFGSSSQGNETE